MLQHVRSQSLVSQLLEQLGVLFRKIMPSHGEISADQLLRRDLKRLATSPHCLEDIGFEKDSAASTPTITMWRKGDICIAVQQITQLVDLHLR